MHSSLIIPFFFFAVVVVVVAAGRGRGTGVGEGFTPHVRSARGCTELERAGDVTSTTIVGEKRRELGPHDRFGSGAGVGSPRQILQRRRCTRVFFSHDGRYPPVTLVLGHGGKWRR
jgi:hypothetical protein